MEFLNNNCSTCRASQDALQISRISHFVYSNDAFNMNIILCSDLK